MEVVCLWKKAVLLFVSRAVDDSLPSWARNVVPLEVVSFCKVFTFIKHNFRIIFGVPLDILHKVRCYVFFRVSNNTLSYKTSPFHFPFMSSDLEQIILIIFRLTSPLGWTGSKRLRISWLWRQRLGRGGGYGWKPFGKRGLRKRFFSSSGMGPLHISLARLWFGDSSFKRSWHRFFFIKLLQKL